MSTSEELQEQAKSEYSSLIRKKGAVGQFKQIVPMTDDIAVAVVRASGGLKAKQDLEHEVALLKMLKEHGLPALQTYGDVFEIAEGKHAVVMDWVPNANLIDGKAPEMINYILPAIMLGVPINTSNEAWAMQLQKVTRNILVATQKSDLQEIQTFARNLSQEIAGLQKVMEEQKLLIGDLQMLITPEGKLTIIDPLDVLRIVPKQPPAQGFDLVDIMDPSKPNSEVFIQSLFKSMEMLDNMKKICDAVVKVEDKQSLQMLVGELMVSHSAPRYGSAPVSPVMPRRAASAVRETRSEPSSPTSEARPASRAKSEFIQPAPKRPADPKRRAAAITPAAAASSAAGGSTSPLKKRVATEKDVKPPTNDTDIKKQPILPKPKSG